MDEAGPQGYIRVEPLAERGIMLPQCSLMIATDRQGGYSDCLGHHQTCDTAYTASQDSHAPRHHV